MNSQKNWPRNRLLLALPSSDLHKLMPELEQIRCEREQILMDEALMFGVSWEKGVTAHCKYRSALAPLLTNPIWGAASGGCNHEALI